MQKSNRLFSAQSRTMINNPKNFTHQQMQANESFNLVKRVMSVRPTISNNRPASFKHLNNDRRNLRKPVMSSQEVFKSYDRDRENKALLNKMLKIMERPKVNRATTNARPLSSASRNMNSSRLSARSHGTNNSQSPGRHATFRKKEQFQI